MRWLLFLSRLAFICGVALIICLSHFIWPWITNHGVESTMIIMGILMALIVLLITGISYLVVFIVRKRLRDVVPIWLIITNVLFLFLIIVYIFYFDDPYYNQ